MYRSLLFNAKPCRWLLLLVIAAWPAAAQTPAPPDTKAQALALYRQGNYPKAVEILQKATQQNPSDAEAWQLLGLALLEKKDFKKARQAFVQAEKINPKRPGLHSQLAYLTFLEGKNEAAYALANHALQLDKDDVMAHYVKGSTALSQGQFQEALEESRLALKINSDLAAAYTLRYQAIMFMIGRGNLSNNPLTSLSLSEQQENRTKIKSLYDEAADSLEAYLRLVPHAKDTEDSQLMLTILRSYDNTAKSEVVFTSTEVSSKAIIKNRYEAIYPERAIKHKVNGTVVLRLLLAADGTVKYIMPLTYLPDGVTEACIRAAQKTKFTPAQKDGRAVGQWVQIEYSFEGYS